jgi:hypothetical protein
VRGNFWDAHNIFAVVSGSPTKQSSIAYQITKDNGNATQFVAFIKMLIVSNWFEHNGILVMLMLESTWPARLSVLIITFLEYGHRRKTPPCKDCLLTYEMSQTQSN